MRRITVPLSPLCWTYFGASIYICEEVIWIIALTRRTGVIIIDLNIFPWKCWCTVKISTFLSVPVCIVRVVLAISIISILKSYWTFSSASSIDASISQSIWNGRTRRVGVVEITSSICSACFDSCGVSIIINKVVTYRIFIVQMELIEVCIYWVNTRNHFVANACITINPVDIITFRTLIIRACLLSNLRSFCIAKIA